MCFKFLTTINRDKEIRREFDRIAATPYDVKHNNCTHKSLEFAAILFHTYEKVDIIFNILPHKDGEYNHAFITWGNRVYDPTSKPPYYYYDYNDYIKIMRKEGFQPHLITQSKIG